MKEWLTIYGSLRLGYLADILLPMNRMSLPFRGKLLKKILLHTLRSQSFNVFIFLSGIFKDWLLKVCRRIFFFFNFEDKKGTARKKTHAQTHRHTQTQTSCKGRNNRLLELSSSTSNKHKEPSFHRTHCSQFTYCWSLAWRILSITTFKYIKFSKGFLKEMLLYYMMD